MVIKHRVTDFMFDKDAWARVIEDACAKFGTNELAALLDVSNAALWHWKNKRYVDGYDYPGMTNFIAVCNLLDLNPAVFFVLEDWE